MKMLRIIHEWASEIKVTLLERYTTSLVVNGRKRYFKIDYRIDRLAGRFLTVREVALGM